MFFNPLFIQSISEQGAQPASANTKISNSKYLFSEIIKVFNESDSALPKPVLPESTSVSSSPEIFSFQSADVSAATTFQNTNSTEGTPEATILDVLNAMLFANASFVNQPQNGTSVSELPQTKTTETPNLKNGLVEFVVQAENLPQLLNQVFSASTQVKILPSQITNKEKPAANEKNNDLSSISEVLNELDKKGETAIEVISAGQTFQFKISKIDEANKNLTTAPNIFSAEPLTTLLTSVKTETTANSFKETEKGNQLKNKITAEESSNDVIAALIEAPLNNSLHEILINGKTDVKPNVVKSKSAATKVALQNGNTDAEIDKLIMQATETNVQTSETKVKTFETKATASTTVVQTPALKVQTFGNESKATETKAQTLETEVQATENDALAVKTEAPTVKSSEQIVKTELKPVAAELQSILAKIQPDIEKLQSYLKEWQPVKAKLQPEVEKLQSVVKELQPVLAAVQAENPKLQNVLTKLQPEVEKLQSVVKELQPVLAEARPESPKLQNVLTKLQPEVEKLQSVFKEMQPVLAEVQAENPALQFAKTELPLGESETKLGKSPIALQTEVKHEEVEVESKKNNVNLSGLVNKTEAKKTQEKSEKVSTQVEPQISKVASSQLNLNSDKVITSLEVEPKNNSAVTNLSGFKVVVQVSDNKNKVVQQPKGDQGKEILETKPAVVFSEMETNAKAKNELSNEAANAVKLQKGLEFIRQALKNETPESFNFTADDKKLKVLEGKVKVESADINLLNRLAQTNSKLSAISKPATLITSASSAVEKTSTTFIGQIGEEIIVSEPIQQNSSIEQPLASKEGASTVTSKPSGEVMREGKSSLKTSENFHLKNTNETLQKEAVLSNQQQPAEGEQAIKTSYAAPVLNEQVNSKNKPDADAKKNSSEIQKTSSQREAEKPEVRTISADNKNSANLNEHQSANSFENVAKEAKPKPESGELKPVENQNATATTQNTNEIKIVQSKEKILPESFRLPETEKTIKSMELSREISKILESGTSQKVVLKLLPEALGKVELTLEVGGEIIHAKAEVENEAVKQIVQTNAETLKQTLSQSGLQLASFNVSLTSSDDKHQKTHGQKKRQNNFGTKSKIEKSVLPEATRSLGYNTYEYLA